MQTVSEQLAVQKPKIASIFALFLSFWTAIISPIKR